MYICSLPLTIKQPGWLSRDKMLSWWSPRTYYPACSTGATDRFHLVFGICACQASCLQYHGRTISQGPVWYPGNENPPNFIPQIGKTPTWVQCKGPRLQRIDILCPVNKTGPVVH